MSRRSALIASILVIALSLLAFAKDWRVPRDFATIQEAVDSAMVKPGDRLLVGPGAFDGALLTKRLEIRGLGRAAITGGPLHPAGLVQGFVLGSGADGSTISHLSFSNEVDLAVMSRFVDDVTITQCTFFNSIQAISNWGGSGWVISHNMVFNLRTRNGGGIGILCADYSGGTVRGNIVHHNRISGTLHVDPGDGGGYNGTGIVLYADFRWGRAGASEISNNRIVKNRIALVSDSPQVVDVAAIELTDTRDDESLDSVIYDNAVGFNDLRGSTYSIVLTPGNLADYNDISRNLGADPNRGHGLHPKLFWPLK